jgi:hypothetical protein
MQSHEERGDKTTTSLAIASSILLHNNREQVDNDELLDGSIPKRDFVRLLIDSLQQLGYRYFVKKKEQKLR